MKHHVKLYLNAFKYDISDFIGCEVCNARATDIHHIKARGIGGSKNKDTVENLMALCRECHVKYGDKKNTYEFLIEIHNRHLHKRTG